MLRIDNLRSPDSRRLTVLIAAAAVISLAVCALLVFGRGGAIRLIGAEAYKALLQFFLVAVLGGGVSLIYQAFNREAELRAHRARQVDDRMVVLRESRQRYLQDLVTEYNAVKRARRMLRAHALIHQPSDGASRINVARYDSLLQEVLDAQLSIEAVVHVVRVNAELFPDQSNIKAPLQVAETYLRSLITEYEQFLPTVDRESAVVELTALPVLGAFIGPYSKAVDFRNCFVHPVRQVLGEIQRLLVSSPSGG